MRRILAAAFGATLIASLLLLPVRTAAHCDGIDGPVVSAARKALQTGDSRHVLVWVQENDEEEIQRAFDQAIAIRKLGSEAADLADRFFFETVVRVHRRGEGAPFDGLKPAGQDLGPAIPAADHALETGNVDDLVKLLREKIEQGVRDRFRAVNDKKGFKVEDVHGGREYVEAYVAYIHFVERLYEDATTTSSGHFHEEDGHPAHQEK